MGLFVSFKKFLREGFIVLSLRDALLAGAAARFAAVEAEAAGVVFASYGGDVWAGHETLDPKRGNPLYKLVSKYPLS